MKKNLQMKTLRMPPELIKNIKKLALELEISEQEFVIRGLTLYVNEVKKKIK